jgi:hypothetical protein
VLRSALGLSVVLATLAASRSPSAGEPAPLPGRPARGAIVSHSNGSCAGCHREIADEWRESLHHKAWVDPVFQKAYAIEPMAFCRGCHAPESDPDAEPSAAAAAAGVGCTTCHVDNGHVVAARANAAPHAVFADARLATTAACAACHEFNFPKESGQKIGEPMQDTAGEHARSSVGGAACQTCHMPQVGEGAKHKSHRFSVIGDPGMIRRAASVRAQRVSATSVAVTLAPAGAGHAFPTGDMFRRLEVRANVVGAPAGAAPVVLARRFEDVPRGEDELGFERVQVEDSRVPPPGAGPDRRVVLKVPEAARGLPIRYEVVYQRMAAPMARAFQVDDVLDEIIVAEGIVP